MNFIIIAILASLLALGIGLLTIYKIKKNKRGPDYYALFWTGIIWLIIGIPLDNEILWILGLIFLLVGLLNKDKWKKNRLDWSNLSIDEKKTRIIIIILLAVLVLIGAVIYISVD